MWGGFYANMNIRFYQFSNLRKTTQECYMLGKPSLRDCAQKSWSNVIDLEDYNEGEEDFSLNQLASKFRSSEEMPLPMGPRKKIKICLN